MPLRFFMLAIGDDEIALARSLLAGSPLEQSGNYLYGEADEPTIRALIQRGCLINVVPEEAPIAPAPGWTAIQLSTVLDDAGAPILDTTPDLNHYYRLTLKGPLTDERSRILADLGISLVRKLSQTSYLVALQPGTVPDAPPAWFDLSRYSLESKLCGGLAARTQAALDRTPAGLGDVAGSGNAAIPLDTAAGQATADNWSTPATGNLPSTYDVRCHSSVSLRVITAWLKSQADVLEVVLGEDRVRFQFVEGCQQERILAMLGMAEEVAAVEEYVPPEFHVSFAAKDVLGTSTVTGMNAMPWRGKGQVIGVADSGVDAEHPDLKGRVDVVLRVPPLSARDPRGHGTHVASIAAGNGAASNGQLVGLAPEARLFVQSLADANLQLQPGVGLTSLLREAYDHGVRIQNYSWGAPVAGRYTLDADDIDAFVYEHPDMLVVIAGGNSGAQSTGDNSAGDIELRSLASPACAKNCITVGASCSSRANGPYAGVPWKSYDGQRSPQRPPMSELPVTGNPGIVAPLSSRGPSDDGRIKPDLIAPGVGIAAATSFDSRPRHLYQQFEGRYQYSTGTSMAAPVVAGAAALLREYFVQERGHTPSAALLKATLINGAQWMEGELWEDPEIGRPNFHQGFGRLVLASTLPISASGFQLEFADIANDAPAALRHGGAQERWLRKLNVKQGHPFSITLAWTDPPGRNLQHELDLVVVSPGARKYVGNGDLRHLPFEQFDLRNNVERVTVAEPDAGEWVVYVFARNTFRGAQGFALAMTGAFT